MAGKTGSGNCGAKAKSKQILFGMTAQKARQSKSRGTAKAKERKKQIPFGNDNQKGKSNGNSNNRGNGKSHLTPK